MTSVRSFIIIAICLLVNIHIFAQDEAVIEYSEEPADSSDFSFKEKYKYLTRANIEEKSMFKVGLSQFGYASSRGPIIGFKVAYEQKVSVPFSLQGEFQQTMNGWSSNSLGLNFNVRYYYAQKSRIRKGKSANNLSANYFALQNASIWFSKYQTVFTSQGIEYQQVDPVYANIPSLLYGYQRRLGRFGYIDINIGPSYNRLRDWRPLYLDFNFSIGIAF